MDGEPVTPLIRLLRRPTLGETPLGRLTVWRWVGWLCLLLLVGAVGGALDSALAHGFGWAVPADSFQNYLVAHASWRATVIVLAAPVLEELGFRAFLSTSSKAVFTGLAFFLTYVYFAVHLNTVHQAGPQLIEHYFDKFWVLLPAAVASLLLYWFARAPILRFFRRRGAWVFWVSCIIFGAGHATVYSDHLVWWSLVLTLPQFLIGIGLAYVRVTFGLRWSIATHLAFDALSVFGFWLYLAAPAGSAIKIVLVGIGFAALLFMLGYGLVGAYGVARRRW